MNPFKEKLETLFEKLTRNKEVLAKCRRRAKKFREIAEQNSKIYRQSGEKDQKAKVRAERASKKSIYWKGRIKKQLARIHFLNDRVAEVEKDAAKWNKENHVRVEKNKVYGAEKNPHGALRAAILAAYNNWKSGDLAGYYSQSGGARDYLHTLYHYALHRIWDCSTFADGVYICCGLTAPSGARTLETGGWTGTQGARGTPVSEEKALPGDLVLYGPYPHHHVEVVLDPKSRTTIGHGSPPIDPGVFDLFGDGDYIIRRYV